MWVWRENSEHSSLGVPVCKAGLTGPTLQGEHEMSACSWQNGARRRRGLPCQGMWAAPGRLHPHAHLEMLHPPLWLHARGDRSVCGGLSSPPQGQIGGGGGVCPGSSYAPARHFLKSSSSQKPEGSRTESGHVAVTSGPPSQADLGLITSQRPARLFSLAFGSAALSSSLSLLPCPDPTHQDLILGHGLCR